MVLTGGVPEVYNKANDHDYERGEIEPERFVVLRNDVKNGNTDAKL